MDDAKRNLNRNKPPGVSQDTTLYEGVRYTPSNRRNPAEGIQRPIRAQNNPSSHKTAGKRLPPKKQKPQLAIFFITTIFVGLLTCVIIFAVVFNSIIGERSADNPSIAASPDPGATVSNAPEPDAEYVIGEAIVAMITAIDPSGRSLSLYELGNGKSLSLQTDGTTELKDKFGNNMVLAEFKEGEIVETEFSENSGLIKKMQASPQAWRLVSNAKVDAEKKTITVANTTYKYTDNIITVYKGGSFDLTSIDPIDLVTVKGYKDTAWYVSLDKSHGTLNITNKPDIINGSIEIDTTTFSSLDETSEFNLSEGSHHIVIKGSNIEVFTKEVTITKGEAYDLDLSEIQLKAGMMTFTINEPDAVLTINGEEKSHKEPVVLDYGEYDLKVTKEGFGDWSKKIKFESPSLEVPVTLEKIVQLSKVTINTIPEGANIYIDNIYVGSSPLTTSVEYGQKIVSVEKEGYQEIKFPMNVITSDIPLDITLQALPPDNVPLDIPSERDAIAQPNEME